MPFWTSETELDVGFGESTNVERLKTKTKKQKKPNTIYYKTKSKNDVQQW